MLFCLIRGRTSPFLFSTQWLFSVFPSDARIRRLMTPCLTPAFLHSICLTKWSLARPAAPPEASHEKACLLGLKRTWEKKNFKLSDQCSNNNYYKKVLVNILLTSNTTLSRWTKTQPKRCGSEVVGGYKPFLQEKVILPDT